MSDLRLKIGRNQLENLERLIALQMLGHSVSGCARLLNISRETVYQWMRNPLFLAMKEREKAEFLTATGDAIIGAALDGVWLLQDLVTDFRIPKTGRADAAKHLVDLGLKFSQTKQRGEHASHEERLARALFPEPVDDIDEPAELKQLAASTVRFDDYFNALHEQPRKAGE